MVPNVRLGTLGVLLVFPVGSVPQVMDVMELLNPPEFVF
jgi:hypothetical protein